MQEEIKQTRQRIDAIIIATKSNIPNNREVALAVTNLQRGQMFLGKVLKELGSVAYTESRDHTSNLIEVREDQATEDFKVIFPITPAKGHIPECELNQTGKIKFIRGLISGLVDGLKGNVNAIKGSNSAFTIDYYCYAYLALDEAGMWLGQQLNNIRLNDERYDLRMEDYNIRMLKEAANLYEAYGNHTNFKNFLGNDMPKFEDLPDTQKEAWKGVAIASGRYLQPTNENWVNDSRCVAAGN